MDYSFCVRQRLLSNDFFYNKNINENENENINENANGNGRINDINYKLLKYINENEIKSIIDLYKEHKNTLCFNLEDNNKNSFLMLAIKKIMPKTVIVFNRVCPIIQKKNLNIMDVCSIFINDECDINKKNICGDSALLLAIKNLRLKEYNDDTDNENIIYRLVDILLKNNADINLADSKGYTALMHCIKLAIPTNKKHCNSIINLLLKKRNIDIAYLGNDGKSALFLALGNKNINQEMIKLILDKYSDFNFETNFIDENLLVKLGDIYRMYGNMDKMKKCYIRAIELGNSHAKSKLFYYYCERNRPDLITEEESKMIKNIFTKPYAFFILLKSRYFHSFGECTVCLEDVNSIIKLPCHNEHFMCLECIYRLKQNICPFCREIFPRDITDF